MTEEVRKNAATRPGRRVYRRLSSVLGAIADLSGHLAAGVLLVLAASVTLGIVLRTIGVDNSWTYDLDLFALIWVAFFGAALTAYRGTHVTSGIALENMLSGRRAILAIAVIRFLIVIAFLVLFLVSGYQQAASSFVNHEKTIDIVQWPVWVAKAALPAGAACWIAAELHRFMQQLAGVDADRRE